MTRGPTGHTPSSPSPAYPQAHTAGAEALWSTALGHTTQQIPLDRIFLLHCLRSAIALLPFEHYKLAQMRVGFPPSNYLQPSKNQAPETLTQFMLYLNLGRSYYKKGLICSLSFRRESLTHSLIITSVSVFSNTIHSAGPQCTLQTGSLSSRLEQER